MSEIIPALCALARRYLARSEEEFAEAAAAGDFGRADAVAGEAVRLSVALERQERAQ